MYNYPVKKKSKTVQNKTAHKNRGLSFEKAINESNEFYALHDKAYICKKPTPIKVVKVSSFSNKITKKHLISEAYYEQASTTDYNGIYRGKYIDFEAKQSKYKTFNLGANLKEHQVKHLNDVYRHNGIAFLIIEFIPVDQIYILTIDKLNNFLKNEKNKTVIPLEYFQKNGYLVESKFVPRVDYLKVVDKIIAKEN